MQKLFVCFGMHVTLDASKLTTHRVMKMIGTYDRGSAAALVS